MNAPGAVLALLAAAAMVLAVVFMTAGRLTAAGALFVSASVVIYLRGRFT
jgi:membrane protein implicated in regulation of membrane protease activity